MSEFEDWTKTYKAKPIAPPSDLVKAAKDAVSTLVLLTNAPYSSAESHEIIMSVVTDLLAVLDKNK